MLFIGRLPSGTAINAPAAFLLSFFLASIVPARASPECHTLAEARAASPSKHLFYRLVGGVKCWSDTGGRARPMLRARDPRPAPLHSAPAAPRPPSVLWPALAGAAPPEAAALYQREPMNRGPVLLDIDGMTAAGNPVSPPLPDANGNEAAKDFCCWPALETAFSERWFAMPASWFPLKGGRNEHGS